jgi:hypothetical protein
VDSSEARSSQEEQQLILSTEQLFQSVLQFFLQNNCAYCSYFFNSAKGLWIIFFFFFSRFAKKMVKSKQEEVEGFKRKVSSSTLQTVNLEQSRELSTD